MEGGEKHIANYSHLTVSTRIQVYSALSQALQYISLKVPFQMLNTTANNFSFKAAETIYHIKYYKLAYLSTDCNSTAHSTRNISTLNNRTSLSSY